MRNLACSIVIVGIVLLTPLLGYSKKVVSLKIWPENVGVFYQNKTQQFQAIAIFDDGSKENYTNKVAWSLRANPLATQHLKPDQVATISNVGLVTVKSSWGRVAVVATYPKPRPNYVELTGVYEVLLEEKCSKNKLLLCENKQSCERVGGFWWSYGHCQPVEQPGPATPKVLPPAIYLLLLDRGNAIHVP